MSTTNTDDLERRLLKFFRDMARAKEADNYDDDKDKFVFHMTDWKSSLESLGKLYSKPSDFSQEETNRILQELCYHVLPHLNAAAEIHDDAVELYKMHSRSKSA